MRTPALIVVAALAGFGIAWLLLTQVPQTAPAPPIAPTAAPPPAAPPVAAPMPASAPIAPKEENPPAVTEKPPPPPSAPAPVDEPKPEATPPTAPPASEPEVGDSEQTDAVEEEPADDAETGPPPIDSDQAADLLADLIARQEAATDESGVPNVTAQTWKKFDQEEADPEWSAPTARQIEQTLDQWIAGLPDDVRDHIAVIHVECRATLCQSLAADNDIDTQNERAQAGQEWQQAIASLPGQPWWNELGFVDASTQVTANEGHTLYMTYLRREVKPPSP
jgi:hypothetical protein